MRFKIKVKFLHSCYLSHPFFVVEVITSIFCMSNSSRAFRIIVGLILLSGISLFVFTSTQNNLLYDPIINYETSESTITQNPTQTSTTTPQPEINFTETGYIKNTDLSKINDALQLVYEELGAPARTVNLKFTEKAMCNFSGHSIICMALSVTIGGVTENKLVEITGVKMGNTVDVYSVTVLQSPTQ
jgi:hypothetical protein